VCLPFRSGAREEYARGMRAPRAACARLRFARGGGGGGGVGGGKGWEECRDKFRDRSNGDAVSTLLAFAFRLSIQAFVPPRLVYIPESRCSPSPSRFFLFVLRALFRDVRFDCRLES